MKNNYAGKTASMILSYSRYLAVITWAFFILIMLSYPMPSSIEHVFTWRDKLAHFALFAVMAIMLVDLFWQELKWPVWDNFRISLAVTAGYIALLETGQYFFPGRTPDFRDSLAGLAGSAAAIGLASVILRNKKPKLLLHICCIACGAKIVKELEKDYQLDLYFYNPNIFPREEYGKRLAEAKRIARALKKKLIIGRYGHKSWLASIKGSEAGQEGGARCLKCYAYRLDATAGKAKAGGYAAFTTTLTISPHKESKQIIRLGKQAGRTHWIKFLAKDFKENSGYRKSLEVCREMSIYRQKYCGCEYSETYPDKAERKKKSIS